jgi:hypothetical protein
MEDVLGALAMFMEQNRRNYGSHEAIVDKCLCVQELCSR